MELAQQPTLKSSTFEVRADYFLQHVLSCRHRPNGSRAHSADVSHKAHGSAQSKSDKIALLLRRGSQRRTSSDGPASAVFHRVECSQRGSARGTALGKAVGKPPARGGQPPCSPPSLCLATLQRRCGGEQRRRRSELRARLTVLEWNWSRSPHPSTRSPHTTSSATLIRRPVITSATGLGIWR